MVNNTEAGDSSIEVAAYSPERQRGKEFDIFFTFLTSESFLHPDSLIWDPTVGLDYDEENTFCMGDLCGAAAIGLVAGLLAGVVLVAVVTLIVYSYRKRANYQSL